MVHIVEVPRFVPVPMALAVAVPTVDAIAGYIVRKASVVSTVSHMDPFVGSNQQTMLVMHIRHETGHHSCPGYYCIANIGSQMLQKIKLKMRNFINCAPLFQKSSKPLKLFQLALLQWNSNEKCNDKKLVVRHHSTRASVLFSIIFHNSDFFLYIWSIFIASVSRVKVSFVVVAHLFVCFWALFVTIRT